MCCQMTKKNLSIAYYGVIQNLVGTPPKKHWECSPLEKGTLYIIWGIFQPMVIWWCCPTFLSRFFLEDLHDTQVYHWDVWLRQCSNWRLWLASVSCFTWCEWCPVYLVPKKRRDLKKKVAEMGRRKGSLALFCCLKNSWDPPKFPVLRSLDS